MKITSSLHIIKLCFLSQKKCDEVDKIPKQWKWEVCRIEKEHAQNTHINIDSTTDGGENTPLYPMSVPHGS